jgi:peroxiredoxin
MTTQKTLLNLTLLIALTLPLALLSGCGGKDTDKPPQRSRATLGTIGERAPELAITTLSGEELNLYDIIGTEERTLQPATVQPATVQPATVQPAPEKPTIEIPTTGKPVVINFWASWCYPCELEAETLEATWRAFKYREVSFIGLALNDTEEDAKAFIKEHDISYPNALDIDGIHADAYGIVALPVTIVIDKNGLISFTHLGLITWEVLAEEIDKAF